MDNNNKNTSAPKLITLRSADKLPRGIICDKGFRILGTPLAFRGSPNPGLLFCSDLDMTVPRGTKRVLGTSLSMLALSAKRKKLDSIAVSYDRLFKLGNMDLRLLPSGMGAGAAMLEIVFKNKSILYTSGFRMAPSLSGEQAAPVPCDILLIDFPALPRKTPAPKTVRAQLLKWCKESQQNNIAAAILCGNHTSLFDTITVCKQLKCPIVAHRTVYNLLRDTGFQTTSTHQVSRLGKQWPTDGVVIMMHNHFDRSPFSQNTKIPKCYCGRADSAPEALPLFQLGAHEHIGGLVKFAKDCAAHTVAISPIGTEQTAEALKKANFKVVYSKTPQQLKLPL